MGLDFSSNQKDSISLKSVHRYFEHGRDSASRKTYEKQSLFTLYRWWDSNPYGNARVGFRVKLVMTTSIHLRVTTIQFSRSMTTVSRIISSQPRYDRFDTAAYHAMIP